MQKLRYKTTNGELIDFKKIHNIQSSMKELQIATDIASKIETSLVYQRSSCQAISSFLLSAYCYLHRIDLKSLTPEQQQALHHHILNDITVRSKIMSTTPSTEFPKYLKQIEKRYNCFIKVDDLLPRQPEELIALKTDNRYIDLEASDKKMTDLVTILKKTVSSHLLPYCQQRLAQRQSSFSMTIS